MPCYDRISGSLKKVKTIYDRINGSLKEVKTGYDRVSGSLKVYHSGTMLLSDVPIGSTVIAKNLSHTVVGKNFGVSGDVVLWSDTQHYTNQWILSGYKNSFPDTYAKLKFEEGTHINAISVTYQTDSEDDTISGLLAWPIPKIALDGKKSALSYFDGTAAKRIRATAYNVAGDSYYMNEDNSRFYAVKTDGSYTYKTNAWPNPSGYKAYHAYSFKGTLEVTKNSDGTYTLNI